MVLGGDWRPGGGRCCGSHVRNPSFPGGADPDARVCSKAFPPVSTAAWKWELLTFLSCAASRFRAKTWLSIPTTSTPPPRPSRCGISPFAPAIRSLLRSPLHISHVEVEGLRINLPPKSQRKELPRAEQHPFTGQQRQHLCRTRWTAPTPSSLWARTSRARFPCDLSSRAFLCAPSVPASRWTSPPS